MLFEIINEGKALRVTAQSRAEAREVISHCKLDPFDYVEAVYAGELVHDIPAYGGAHPATWFELETHLGPEWVAPYMDRLKVVTGYAGPIPTLDNVPWNNYGWSLCHTHHVARAWLDAAGYHAVGFVQAGPWNGRMAQQHAQGNFSGYVREHLGRRPSEPEYLELDNGLLKRNPNYLKRHSPVPALTNHALFEALVGWWLGEVANDAQRDWLHRSYACYRGVCKQSTIGEWLVRERDGLRTSWDEAAMSFADFAGLK